MKYVKFTPDHLIIIILIRMIYIKKKKNLFDTSFPWYSLKSNF